MYTVQYRMTPQILKTPTMDIVKKETLESHRIIETPIGAVWVKSYALLGDKVIQIHGFTVRDTYPVIFNNDSGWEDPNVWYDRVKDEEVEIY